MEEKDLHQIRSLCLSLAKDSITPEKGSFVTIEEVIEAAKKFEEYILRSQS